MGSCAAVRRGTTPTRGGGCGGGAGEGGAGGRGRQRVGGESGSARRRLSGSWVSGNVRCRDIRQPPSSSSPAAAPRLPLAPSPFRVRRTNPIPATKPDRRTTGSSSSSPLIRLSRYRHRRPGNPSPLPRPAHRRPLHPPPCRRTLPPHPDIPRREVQPRYPHPPIRCT